jgi:adenosine deaminase
LQEDPEVERYVLEHQIPLEVCLTSNVHTHTVDGIAEHPIRRYLDLGCKVTVNTDSRLIDGITLSDEYWLAHTQFGLTRGELDRVILNAFESAFLPEAEKTALIARVQRELEETT